MREDIYWLYTAPLEGGGHEVVRTSEDEIRRLYYPYWSREMWKVEKQADITFENCLQDWVAVHWAWREEEE